ncbi:GH1 family beta-glucosidase [Chloroflexota bacterium]
MAFPEGFVWGAAAASYQLEGAAQADGKGLSVWDQFSHTPGKVYNGNTGDVACDHYHRYKEDVGLMKEIGLHAYRLSISWPRVIPAGTGAVNEAGLDFYDRLIDELLANQITPYVTLFHWDFPYDLYCRGSWLNRDSVDWFADYSTLMAERLGDRVKHWMPLNEPSVFVQLGYLIGEHAPGDKLAFNQVLQIAHHVLLAQGKSIQAIRAAASDTQVGAALAGAVMIPATESPEDIEAARQAMFTTYDKHIWLRHWWADPVFFGKYPEDGVAFFGEDMPEIQVGDMETIQQPLDFYGMNIYHGTYIKQGADGKPEMLSEPVGYPVTAFHWPVAPESLYWGPRFISERYNVPIMITENGLANTDWVSVDGKVHDPQRIDFTTRYLRNYGRAFDDGVDIRAYFHWSIMDNFEWAEGMKHRFGMIHVDYATLKRTLKDSAYWYKDVIVSNGATLTEE